MKSELGCSAYRKRRGRELRLTSEVAIMSRRGLSIAVLCLTCLAGPVSAQTNNGYVGVFGDAAGTIRCMTAPPGAPTTLYVVARTAGVTANGITGAEFRVEVANPSGYLFSYAAPESAVTIGDPVGATGLNIAFQSCRASVDSIISLGTIAVFNTGGGGQTDITVRRRSPPTNGNYQCALFISCDEPFFSKSCMTAPQDSVSCLTQKARASLEMGNDEFTTSLAADATVSGHWYGGYNFAHLPGEENIQFVMAECDINYAQPGCCHLSPCYPQRVARRVLAYLDLDNNAASLNQKLWLQTGWLVNPFDWTPYFYFEFNDGNNQRGDFIRDAAPFSGSIHYKIWVDGFNLKAAISGPDSTLTITTDMRQDDEPHQPGHYMGRDPLCIAKLNAETHDSQDDYMPGCQAGPLVFTNVRLQQAHSAVCASPMQGWLCEWDTHQVYGEYQHPHAAMTGLSLDSFSVWDAR